MQMTEQRLERLEKHNRRLMTALTLMAVAMCAVVTAAATGGKDGDFEMLTARMIFVKNDAGKFVISLAATGDGEGMVKTYSAQGKYLVDLGSSSKGGRVTTYQRNGKELVAMGSNDSGGMIEVYNKTGEGIAQMYADEYGNGLVGAYNRKGRGRTLKPGP